MVPLGRVELGLGVEEGLVSPWMNLLLQALAGLAVSVMLVEGEAATELASPPSVPDVILPSPGCACLEEPTGGTEPPALGGLQIQLHQQQQQQHQDAGRWRKDVIQAGEIFPVLGS